MEYRIYDENIERLDQKMSKLKKKFEKLSATLVYEKLREEFENFGNEENPDIRRFIIVNVEGNVQINGWKIIGKLEQGKDANLITSFASQYTDLLTQFRTTQIKCEHCNTKAQRKYSYILLNEDTNELKQVGTACLKEFVGISATKYASFLSCFDDIAEFEVIPQSASSKTFYKTDAILNVAIQLIDTYGYTSKTTYDSDGYPIYHDDATSIAVSEIMRKQKPHRRYQDFKLKDATTTTSAISELKAFFDELTPKNEYESNVKLAIKNEYVDSKKIALLAASIQTKRIYDQERKRLSELTSVHVGNIGDKIQLENCTLQKTGSYETEFGVTYIYKIISGTNTFVWKTGKFLDSQESVTLKGTIKAHNEFRNEKQTVLTRVKIIPSLK